MRKKIYFLLIILIVLPAFVFASCADNAENGKLLPGDLTPDKIPAIGNGDEIQRESESETENEREIESAIGTETEQTPAPSLIARTFLAPGRYCVAGSGEEGAEIRVEGGDQPVFGKVIDGQFIVELFLEARAPGNTELKVYAKSAGKAESEPLNVVIARNEPKEYKPVHIGKNNHIHFNDTLDDFFGRGLFSGDDLALIKRGAENLQQSLIDEGLKTQVIIFIPNNPSTIYPETMPDFLFDRIESDNSRLKQLDELFKDSTVKFMNPYERMMKEKENYFIYHTTDTHWNELGAYFGYCELFDYIGETFPAAKPRPLEDFNVYKSRVRGGDIIPMMKLDQNKYTETPYIVRIKNPTIHELFRGDTDEIAYQETQYHGYLEFNKDAVSDKSKPTILMYRDSYSISMLSPMAETSGRIVFYHMWNYEISVSYVKEINPDFLIIQHVERLIHDFPSIFWKFARRG